MMTPYHSFLLRLWRVSAEEPPLWRASLENPHTHEVLGFNDLDALADYLRGLTHETGLSCTSGAEAWTLALHPDAPVSSGSPR
jgi:hypothetical protein